MKLISQYQADIAANNIQYDVEQERILTYLQGIQDEIMVKQTSVWRRDILRKVFNRKNRPIQGLYVWGSVGVGKTYLMDLFYNNLLIKRKLRMHFHSFMAEVHQLLARLQGRRNPLQIVARYFSAKTQILCFDEFFVSDIADAMILGNLLTALFDSGVCLVATSNVPPADLYRNGLQRSAFLPTIALLEKYTQVEHIITKQDYRLRNLTQAGAYLYPLDCRTQAHLLDWFKHYALAEPISVAPLLILHRLIPVIRRASTIVWFDFKHICHSPRSQNDYIEITKQYEVIIISNVPQLTDQDLDAVAYFINLIDICYDRRIKLLISASVPISELYLHGRLKFEFQRTASRLQEMQSNEYINSSHKNF